MIVKLNEELNELTVKRNKLLTFITANPKYRELDISSRRMLNKQLDIMSDYVNILKARIKHMEVTQ